MFLLLVRDEEVGGSNPLAPTNRNGSFLYIDVCIELANSLDRRFGEQRLYLSSLASGLLKKDGTPASEVFGKGLQAAEQDEKVWTGALTIFLAPTERAIVPVTNSAEQSRLSPAGHCT